MTYPLIILGAGASYDCIDISQFAEGQYASSELHKFKPPLANELFDTRRFYEVLNVYPEVSSLAAYLNNRLRNGQKSFEECLTDVRNNKVQSNPERAKQIIALSYYLADLFNTITVNSYRSVNNYVDLIQQIQDKGGNVCFVNFNYDLILEKSLNFKNEKINEYITGTIKVIKMHGAYNWFYTRRIEDYDVTSKSCYELSINNADYWLSNDKKAPIIIKDVKVTKHLHTQRPDGFSSTTFNPAIAIPVQNKNNYICPEEHIVHLHRAVSLADRILIIGWRANDPYLVELLIEKLKDKSVAIAIVGGKKAKDEILPNLGVLASKVTMIDQDGFTNFMVNGGCEKFLS